MMLFKRMVLFTSLPALALAAVITVGHAAESEDGQDWSQWAVHDARSNIRLNHELWTKLLDYAVIPHEETAKRDLKRQRELKLTGSRVARGANSGVNKKINYLPFDFLNDGPQFRMIVSQYLEGLQDIEVSKLNRDDQLAYWLNFHNAGLVRNLVANYPVRKLEKVIARDGKRQGFYYQKRFTVEGARLSLADMRDHIILANWKDDLVIYGIYQGTISSPNLLTEAFNAQNVHSLLERNAKDFINSPRGALIRGKTVKYSTIYERNPGLFGDSQAILAHLREYAVGDTVRRLAGAQKFATLKYSWKLAESKRKRTSLSGRAEGLYDLDRYRNIGLYETNPVRSGSD